MYALNTINVMTSVIIYKSGVLDALYFNYPINTART